MLTSHSLYILDTVPWTASHCISGVDCIPITPCLASLEWFLPRDAMQARPMRHAVSVCLSVTFVHSVKTNKSIFSIFPPSRSHAIVVFPYQTARQYSDGNSHSGASNAGGVGRNRDSELISGFTACCEPFQRQVQCT